MLSDVSMTCVHCLHYLCSSQQGYSQVQTKRGLVVVFNTLFLDINFPAAIVENLDVIFKARVLKVEMSSNSAKYEFVHGLYDSVTLYLSRYNQV